MDFDPDKREDLALMLYLFERLSPEQKQEIRDGMDAKYRELAQQHMEDITNYLKESPLDH